MKKELFLGLLFLGTVAVNAQEEELSLPEQNAQKIEMLEGAVQKINNLKISGYMQAQWQLAQQDGIGAPTSGGAFPKETNNRYMIRRGRIKLSYSYGIATMVIQPDFTEKGVGLKDAYLNLTSKSKVIGGQAGIFDRPFGYEISYSSSLRESPERSRVFQSLFPGERDMGVMLQLQGKSGILNNFTLNAGVFAGNGIGSETDSRKDFMGRLAYLKKFENTQVGAALSYYNGGIKNPIETNFEFVKDAGFVEQNQVKGKYSKREYFGVAGQLLHNSIIGTTNIRAEYLWGSQPGTVKTNANPGGSSLGVGTLPLYERKFDGLYTILVQDIGTTKHSLVLKYDYYDPNTQVKKDQIGQLAGTGASDISYHTYGIGYLYRWNANIRLMAYYDIVSNEKSKNMGNTDPLNDFSGHIKQNVLTVRAQIKF